MHLIYSLTIFTHQLYHETRIGCWEDTFRAAGLPGGLLPLKTVMTGDDYISDEVGPSAPSAPREFPMASCQGPSTFAYLTTSVITGDEYQ